MSPVPFKLVGIFHISQMLLPYLVDGEGVYLTRDKCMLGVQRNYLRENSLSFSFIKKKSLACSFFFVAKRSKETVIESSNFPASASRDLGLWVHTTISNQRKWFYPLQTFKKHVYMCVVGLCVCLHADACRVQKRTLDPPELEVQVAVGCPQEC